MPIGGLKEKLLAAHRGQVQTVMIPRSNQKDLQEVPKQLKREMEIVLVNKVTDVLRRALVWN